LYKRLVLREQRMPPRPLGPNKAKTILLECIAGLSHLHLQASMVHRDLKPENIVVKENGKSLTVKIADFDVAAVARKGDCLCRGKVGTFPFFAPEVIKAAKYDPFPTDIWSLGVVFLEVICRVNVLKKGLCQNMPEAADQKGEEALMSDRIEAFLLEPGNVKVISQRYANPDMITLLDDAQTLLHSMLCVPVKERWSALELRQASNTLIALTCD